MVKRLHIYYSGSVQGVGFRFMAERVAMSLGLSGWVRNLSDGRVEVVAEGDEKTLSEFTDKISAIFGNYITSFDRQTGKATGEFETFDIRS